MFCKGLNYQLQLQEEDLCLCSQQHIDYQNMLQKVIAFRAAVGVVLSPVLLSF